MEGGGGLPTSSLRFSPGGDSANIRPFCSDLNNRGKSASKSYKKLCSFSCTWTPNVVGMHCFRFGNTRISSSRSAAELAPSGTDLGGLEIKEQRHGGHQEDSYLAVIHKHTLFFFSCKATAAVSCCTRATWTLKIGQAAE